MEKMGAKKLNKKHCDWENEKEKLDDPDYFPSGPSAKKRKTKKSTQVKSKASDIPEKSDRENEQKKKIELKDLYDNTNAQFFVLVETERTLARLRNDIPRFLKCMRPSNVEGGFWMHIPKKFCDLHLPNHNSRIVLVDDSGKEHNTKFILASCGLSAGWRTFSFLHELKKGEILIFQLLGPCKLKVHIVRIPDPDTVVAAIGLLDIGGSSTEPEEAEGLEKKATVGLNMLLNYVPSPLDAASPQEGRRRCTKPNCRLC